jgi:hypothetical protein
MNSDRAALIDQRIREDGLIKRAAECFLYVAFISLFNSIFYVCGFRLDILLRLWGGLGLGVTELISVLAHRAGGVVPILALILNLILSGAFIVFWYFARKGNLWAFSSGAGLFALDGIWILLTWPQPYANVAFHVFELLFMLGGVYSISRLERLEQPD